MVGCPASVSFELRGCPDGYQLCSARDWVEKRGGRSPGSNYWVAEELLYSGNDQRCVASPTAGARCGAGSMAVCAATGEDAQGNSCDWENCGLEGAFPNEFFGGCASTAGFLCCPESDAERDSDGDGVVDSADNCPEVFNPGQEDHGWASDGFDAGNGIGDKCDCPCWDVAELDRIVALAGPPDIWCQESFSSCGFIGGGFGLTAGLRWIDGIGPFDGPQACPASCRVDGVVLRHANSQTEEGEPSGWTEANSAACRTHLRAHSELSACLLL